MIKIIDVDELFDKYISDYVYQNIGKVKPEEIENKIPELYVQFGDEKLEQLDGKTPNEFYKQYSGKELVECLKEHIIDGVSVSDFLCEALSSEINEDAIIKALDDDENEEFLLYLMNILADIGWEKAKDKYLQFVLWDYSETIKEVATETLKTNADLVKEQILAQFDQAEEKTKENLVEILSGCSKDEKVFEILINEFIKNQNNIPLYAGYLAKYGEERSLPFLKAAIENERISYVDFEELRFAIEALGGEYTKTRDFSKDKTFKKIKGDKKIIN